MSQKLVESVFEFLFSSLETCTSSVHMVTTRLLLIWNVLLLVSASFKHNSSFDDSPCEYMRVMHSGRPHDNTQQCRAQILADLAAGHSFFEVNAPSSPVSPPSAPAVREMWLRLIAFYTDAGMVARSQCISANAATISDAAARNIELISTDRAAPGLVDLLRCYYSRNRDKFYVSGYLNFLKPLLNMFDISANRDHVYGAYHGLTSGIFSGFASFGNIVPTLWYERIRDAIGQTGPTDRWFDHLLRKAITSFPFADGVVQERLAQIFFVFGRNGAIAAYQSIAKIIHDIVKDAKKDASPIQFGSSGVLNTEQDVEVFIFNQVSNGQYLETITKEAAENIRQESHVLERLGSVLPTTRATEFIRWGVYSDVFDSLQTRAYADYVLHANFVERKALEGNFLVEPQKTSEEIVYNGLKKLFEQETKLSNGQPIDDAYSVFRSVAIKDICRKDASLGLPRSFTQVDLDQLDTVRGPSGVLMEQHEEFDALIASINDSTKRSLLSDIPDSTDECINDPYSYTMYKLMAVLFFEFGISYIQTTSRTLGGLVEFCPYRPCDFNSAIHFLSAVLPAALLINDRVPFETFSNLVRDSLAPAEFPPKYPDDIPASVIQNKFLTYFPLDDIPDPPRASRRPHIYPQRVPQYLFSHSLNCGPTATIATAILIARRLDDVDNIGEILEGRSHFELHMRVSKLPEFRIKLFRIYVARMFDLYNILLFRDTLDDADESIEKYSAIEKVIREGNGQDNEKDVSAAASLRITDGGIMKLFTCGPLSYFRIRDTDGCSETFSFNTDIGWDMVAQLRNDERILTRFRIKMLCAGEADGGRDKLRQNLELALSEEKTVAKPKVSVQRYFYVAGLNILESMKLDEENSALDCIGLSQQGENTAVAGAAAPPLYAPVTQITCVFNHGPEKIYVNRKMKERCEQNWWEDDTEHLNKVRSMCPSLGANYIRLQQAAYRAKIDEFVDMVPLMEAQNYTSKPTDIGFNVALIGPGGSHIRLTDSGKTVVEVWPIGGAAVIPTIPFMDKVVKEALVARSYLPCIHDKTDYEEFRIYFQLDIRDTVLSIVDETAVLACKFFRISDRYDTFTLYRYWERRGDVFDTRNLSNGLKMQCDKAGSFWYLFTKTVGDVVTRPQKYRSSTGFEDNNRIMEYMPSEFEGDTSVVVDYRRRLGRNGGGGFKVSKRNECSIEFEIVGGVGHDTETWKHMSGHFRDVCRKKSSNPLDTTLIPKDSAFYCDDEVKQIRCELIAGGASGGSGGEIIVITQTSPINLVNDFTQSLRCDKSWKDGLRSSWIIAYNKAVSDHCLSLGTDFVSVLRSFVRPSAPPAV